MKRRCESREKRGGGERRIFAHGIYVPFSSPARPTASQTLFQLLPRRRSPTRLTIYSAFSTYNAAKPCMSPLSSFFATEGANFPALFTPPPPPFLLLVLVQFFPFFLSVFTVAAFVILGLAAAAAAAASLRGTKPATFAARRRRRRETPLSLCRHR